MNCEKFEELITDYLDGELNFTEKKEFEKHMFECVKCKELFSQVLENLEILNEFKGDDEEIYSEIADNFQKSIVFKEEKSHKRSDIYKKIISTAAIFIIGFLMLNSLILSKNKSFSTYSIAVNSIQKIASIQVFSEKTFYKVMELKDKAKGMFYKTKDSLDIKYNMVKKYTLSSNNEKLRR